MPRERTLAEFQKEFPDVACKLAKSQYSLICRNLQKSSGIRILYGRHRMRWRPKLAGNELLGWRCPVYLQKFGQCASFGDISVTGRGQLMPKVWSS